MKKKNLLVLTFVAGSLSANLLAQTAGQIPPAPGDSSSPAADPAPLAAPPATDTDVPAIPPAPPAPEDIPAPIDPAVAVDPAIPPAPGDTPGDVATFTGASTGGALDFQGDEIATVLRLLARQAGVNLYVSEQVVGTLTMRIEGKSPLEAIRFIVRAKGLILDEDGRDFFVKTAAEKAAEPMEPGSFTFSYATAAGGADLFRQKIGPNVQVDARTNTIFYMAPISRMQEVQEFLTKIDQPTKQVMIEARLVEVNANPKQSYGINWAGVLGSSGGAKVFKYGASPIPENGTYEFDVNEDGSVQLLDFLRGGESQPRAGFGFRPDELDRHGGLLPNDLNDSVRFLDSAAGQFAILSVPQMSLSLRLLNEDSDAEFLAHPRIVTADNQEATIKITRNQPVPQLNFNEQTATAVFGGFEDKEFGNTLTVRPTINKDNFVTLRVRPQISNKVADAVFNFAGAQVTSPIIDTRQLESNVLIRSGDTLAIGGLLQDETTKGSTKVPVLGDIPVLGYLFQEKLNSRSKRNLLVFVTPTIIELGGMTGLEDQVNGLRDSSGEEYADPNGWRNNAKGAIRLVPTAKDQNASAYPKPGAPMAPKKVSFKGAPAPRE
jgi:type IV pilus assembly protein PilQ